jgi:DNA-directed RNA polymerase subunit RPC12/RpoP
MAGAATDAGAEVACPSCGRQVLQKQMIPVLGGGGGGVAYLCVECARALRPASVAG